MCCFGGSFCSVSSSFVQDLLHLIPCLLTCSLHLLKVTCAQMSVLFECSLHCLLFLCARASTSYFSCPFSASSLAIFSCCKVTCAHERTLFCCSFVPELLHLMLVVPGHFSCNLYLLNSHLCSNDHVVFRISCLLCSSFVPHLLLPLVLVLDSPPLHLLKSHFYNDFCKFVFFASFLLNIYFLSLL